MIVLMVGVIASVIDEKAVHNNILSTVTTIVALLGVFWMMITAVRLSPYLGRSGRQPGRRAAPVETPVVASTSPTNKLNAGDTFQPVPSVIENTTELLHEPRKVGN